MFELKIIMNKPTSRIAGLLVLVLVLLVDAAPALAQFQLPMQMLMTNPFAGRMGAMGAGAMAPYGSQAGAMPHVMQSNNGLMMTTQNSRLARTSAPRSMGEMLGLEELTGRRPPMRMAERAAGEEGGEIEASEIDAGEGWAELLVGACAGGAFIGAFAAATAVSAAPVAAAIAAPAAVTVAATAIGIGCGIGVATASVSFGAIFGYRALAN